MKKILSLCLTMIIIVSCITACSNGANRFYNSKVLKEFQITDFPKPQDAEYVSATNSILRFNTTADGFENYAKQLYTYLVEKEFKYFGYRGDVLSTFFGGAPEYEFYISSEFSEHQYLVDGNGIEYENCYIFVFSNELSEDNGLLNKCEIKLTYRPDDEECNSYISINYVGNQIFSYTLITDYVESDISKLSGITREDYEYCTVFRFNNFSGSATLSMDRLELDAGVIYYTGKLSEGTVSVKYDRGPHDSTETLYTFYKNVNIPKENTTVGKINQSKLNFIFEASAPATGEIIISFVPFDDLHVGKLFTSELHHWWELDFNIISDVILGYGDHESLDSDLFCDICGNDMSK